jgi:hypothetical protein
VLSNNSRQGDCESASFAAGSKCTVDHSFFFFFFFFFFCFIRPCALLVPAQTNAVELAAVPHEQLRLLALQCCISIKELREALLHHATVTVNRSNAGRRRRANPQQLAAAMSAAEVQDKCTAEYLRKWRRARRERSRERLEQGAAR